MKQHLKRPGNITVVFVDDDAEDTMYFKEALDEVIPHNNFISFNSAKNAISYFENEDTIIPDILFLDLNIPGMSGLECLKKIRSLNKYSGLPIAIYSTGDTDRDKQATLAGGANIFIKKPNSYQNLKVTIYKVLHIQWQYRLLNFSMETFVFSIATNNHNASG